jgi:type I restriction enzyme S subunit
MVLDRNKYYLQYDDGKKQSNLKKIQILSCPIPLPPLAEQHRIVAKVDELMALCDQLKYRLTEANQLQQKLADVVIEQAIN